MRKIYLLLLFFISFFGFGQNFNPADIDPTFNDFPFPENYHYVDKSVVKTKVISGDKLIVLDFEKIVKLNGNILDTSFNTGTGFKRISNAYGGVSLYDFVIQADGKILISGIFEIYDDQNVGRLIRLHPDGSLDTSFDFVPNGLGKKIFLQPDGKVLVVGSYLGGTNSTVCRLNSDGSVDETFNAPSNYEVNNLGIQADGKIIISYGNLDDICKISRLNADGTNDSSFSLANFYTYNDVSMLIFEILIQNDGKILVSGRFTGCNAVQSRDLIRFNVNGVIDSSFVLEPSYYSSLQWITDILIQEDNKIIVSGSFEYMNKYRIFRVNENGSTDNTFASASDFLNMDKISSMDLFSDGKIIVAGDASYGGSGRKYDSYIVKLNTDGARDSSFNNKGKGFFCDYRIGVVEETMDGKLLIGGDFHTYNDAECYSFTRLSQDGVLDTTLTYGGLGGFENNTYPYVSALAEKQDGKIYIGGKFDSYNGQPVKNIIRINLDGTTDNGFNLNEGVFPASTSIKSILVKPDGGIYVAGNFTKLNNTECNGLISLSSTGSLDAMYFSSFDGGNVKSIKYQGSNKLLACSGPPYGSKGMRRFNTNLTLDNTFIFDPILMNANVNSFDIQQDGKIIINGSFEKNGDDFSLLRILENGSLDTSFNFTLQNASNIVQSFTILPDQKILILLAIDSYLGKIIRLNTDGSIDYTFEEQVQSQGTNIKIKSTANNKILLYNGIINYQGQRVGGLTRLMGENYYFLTGQNRLDLNGNGCEIEDDVFSNLKYHVTGGTDTSFDFVTNTSGNFNMGLTAGNYTVTPTFENPSYFSVSPSSLPLNFPVENSPAVQDFCITPLGVHPDMEIILLPIEVARPGFDIEYKIILKNKGNQTQSGTVNLNYEDAIMDFVSAQPIVANQSANNLIWNFVNLKPFETKEIVFKMNLNAPTEEPSVTDETLLTYTINSLSSLVDETPSDNTFVLNQEVVNSFDPNDKTCLEGAFISDTKVGDYVHYLIRFENTGTYQAQNIKVKDVIDTTKFDINTLVPLSGSHSFVTRIHDGNRVEFFFENINLPFANNINDGYVTFKIKTNSSLVDGDTFSNSAAIYFDYNFPIITNNETTMVQGPLSNEEFINNDTLVIYPNPAENILNIRKIEDVNFNSIRIYNTLGQLMIIIPSGKNIETIDVSGLSAGNYILEINTDTNRLSSKFIKL